MILLEHFCKSVSQKHFLEKSVSQKDKFIDKCIYKSMRGLVGFNLASQKHPTRRVFLEQVTLHSCELWLI